MPEFDRFQWLNIATASILSEAGYTHILPLEHAESEDGHQDFIFVIVKPEKGATKWSLIFAAF